MAMKDFARVPVESVSELRNWLFVNHESPDSIWLVTYKKSVAGKYVSREEVLDELSSFGWIDGIRQAIDEQTTAQLISPRKTRPWAKSYKERADRLIAEGRMQPAGAASVLHAKNSGAWDEMNDVDELSIPDDLHVSLKSRGNALTLFEGFPPSTRRNILRWIGSAKTTQTRARRIEATAAEAEQNRRIASHG